MADQTLMVRDARDADYEDDQMFPARVIPTGHFVAIAEDSGVPFLPWTSRMPISYDNGQAITFKIDWLSVNVSSGDVVWQVEIERLTPNGNPLDSDNFDTPQSVTATVSGTVSAISRAQIVFSQAQFDGITSGDDFRLRLTRNTSSGSDTLIGDAMLLNWSLESDVDD